MPSDHPTHQCIACGKPVWNRARHCHPCAVKLGRFNYRAPFQVGEPPPPPDPCPYPPGHPLKVAAMELRLSQGFHIHHPDDATELAGGWCATFGSGRHAEPISPDSYATPSWDEDEP